MKKTLLLLTLSLACIMSHAQKIDTALIKGRWKLYSLRNLDHTIYRDSTDAIIKSSFALDRDHNPDIQLTATDSLRMANKYKIQCDIIFKTFMEYDGNRHVTELIGLNKDIGGELPEERGEYKWTADNKIIQKLGNGPPETLTILNLTKSKLVLLYNSDGPELTFTRAK